MKIFCLEGCSDGIMSTIAFSLRGEILNILIEKYMKTHFPNIFKIMKYQLEAA